MNNSKNTERTQLGIIFHMHTPRSKHDPSYKHRFITNKRPITKRTISFSSCSSNHSIMEHKTASKTSLTSASAPTIHVIDTKRKVFVDDIGDNDSFDTNLIEDQSQSNVNDGSTKRNSFSSSKIKRRKSFLLWIKSKFIHQAIPSSTTSPSSSVTVSPSKTQRKPSMHSNYQKVSKSINPKPTLNDEVSLIVNEVGSRLQHLIFKNQSESANHMMDIHFCGTKTTDISISTYINHLVSNISQLYRDDQSIKVVNNSTGIRSLVMATIYIDKLCKKNPEFVIRKENVHRLYFTAMMLAIKYSEDLVPEKSVLASVGGLSEKTVDKMESAMINMLEWNLHIKPEEYFKRLALLCKFAKLESDCAMKFDWMEI